MKNAFVIMIWFCSFSGWSQSIEVFAGVTDNHFYDNVKNDGHHTASYISSNGFSFGLAIEDVKVSWHKMRVSLRYDKYSGTINVGNGSLGGRENTIAEIDKSLISLGVYPVNFTVFRKLNFNFGVETSRLLSESIQGMSSGYLMGQLKWNDNLEEKYNRFNSLFTFGIGGRVSCDLSINESITLTPQYNFYYGVTGEFTEAPEETKSMRNFIGVGIKNKLNRN